MKTRIILLLAFVFIAVGCSKGCNPTKPGETSPTPAPSPVNVCDPVTQQAPHWGTKNGACLKSCGSLNGTQSQVACEGDKVSAGPAYDVAFCCKNPPPPPEPTPAKCPCLRRWGIKPHIYMTGNSQMTDRPVRGGYIVFDTTPRFGSGNGTPCNSEKDGCNGRKCEDPRGPDFSVDGPSEWKPLSNQTYQVKVGPLKQGRHAVTARPRAGLHDEMDQPVNICEDSANGGASTSIVEVP